MNNEDFNNFGSQNNNNFNNKIPNTHEINDKLNRKDILEKNNSHPLFNHFQNRVMNFFNDFSC